MLGWLAMTAAEFRKIALGLPQAIEASHVGHPDFRVGARGRIFATLGYPDARFGVLILTPEQQRQFVTRYPKIFSPAKGAWGRRGSTQILLEAADRDLIKRAMQGAWRKVAPKRLAEKFA
jgi:hypothetical protein